MDRRRFLSAAGAGAVASLAGCTTVVERLGVETETAVTADVEMTIDSYRPEVLEISPGDTVEFLNTSSHAHTVTAFDNMIPDEAEYFASGGFDNREEAEAAWHEDRGGAIEIRESYEHTFEVPGEYGYFCVPHIRADMIGTIEVR